MGDLRHPVSSVQPRCRILVRFLSSQTNFSLYIPLSAVGAGGRLFSTPKERFFLRRGRGGVVVDEVLGESFEGILVSDFYVAYHHYPGLKQRCWAHPRPGSGAGSAAGHSRAEGLVPGRRRAGPVGIGSATALRQRPGMGGGRGTPSVPRTVGTGRPVAGAVPAFPGRPVGSASQALPAD